MDLMSGLTAASQAIQIVKDLRGIDRSIDEASFRLALAELTEKLADTKIALSQAKELIAEHEAEIRVLKKQIEEAKTGEVCPKCRTGTLVFESERDHPTFGVFGDKERQLVCSNTECYHRTTRRIDSGGRVK